MQQIAQTEIIARLDSMPALDANGKQIRKNGRLVYEPNVSELARQLAQEKHNRPTAQQVDAEKRQIQKLNKRRNSGKELWWPQRVQPQKGE